MSQEQFTNWCEALKTEEPATVAALYDTNATLIPTLSNEIRRSTERIQDYFVHFLAKQPVCTDVESETMTHAEGVVERSGIYSFQFGDGSTGKARYTFLYKNTQIIHHHSSLLPE